MELEIMEVIRVTSFEGNGRAESPNRKVTRYFTRDGELLSIHDTYVDQ